MSGSGAVTIRIIRYIKDGILQGRWKVGECIPSENELCRELSVSRVSVRNALQQFIALGILRSEHGKGTFLVSDDLAAFETPYDSSQGYASRYELWQILELRSMIEPQICGRVAVSAGPELIARLEEHLLTMQNSVGKAKEFINADVAFHLEICEAYGNTAISEIIGNILRKRAQQDSLVSLANGYYGGIYYHGKILDAIKAHDEKRAAAVMQEHLRLGMEEIAIDAPADDKIAIDALADDN